MNIGATQERKGFQVNTQALTTKTVKSVIKHVFGPFLEPKGPGIKEWLNFFQSGIFQQIRIKNFPVVYELL